MDINNINIDNPYFATVHLFVPDSLALPPCLPSQNLSVIFGSGLGIFSDVLTSTC